MLTRGFVVVLVALAAVTTVAVSAAAPDRKGPRIVSAVMRDTNRDTRADSVKLTYSERVRHARDRDGRYPFTVSGYRVRSVEIARGKTLVIALVEQARPDPTAKPAIRYRLTRSNPVTGRKGLQAVAQLYRAVRPHGNAPPPPPPPLPPPPPPPPGARDSDGDGTPDAQDCAPQDPAVHLRAPDPPDLGFLDSNCDGIDGEEAKAIFVSPVGSDVNPGSKAQPKRQIQAAVDVAAGKDRYVLAAAGSYARVATATGVGIYGGYDAASWSRKADLVTSIAGSPEGVYAEGAKDVVLQLLSVRGISGGESAYGIRAISDSSLRLERVTVVAGDAATGVAGVNGLQGAPGSSGQAGGRGACDSFVRAIGGAGGASPVSRDGGKGGNGYYEIDGEDGAKGLVGTQGGEGGNGGQPASNGRRGANGTEGAPGVRGSGGVDSTALASTAWRGRSGGEGIYGAPGNGGGGG
ncbi:MAG: hypothetical protein M3377_02750, partial [Actinomycetota bacterium]|nr:hypothetical protein [Actinomycetota bacterium]